MHCMLRDTSKVTLLAHFFVFFFLFVHLLISVAVADFSGKHFCFESAKVLCKSYAITKLLRAGEIGKHGWLYMYFH